MCGRLRANGERRVSGRRQHGQVVWIHDADETLYIDTRCLLPVPSLAPRVHYFPRL